MSRSAAWRLRPTYPVMTADAILIEGSDREATDEAIAWIVSTVSDHDIDPKRLAP